MSKEVFHQIGESIPNSSRSKLFGKDCYKLNGKAFICFFEECMVFKLNEQDVQNTLKLDKAILFDPSKKGRPMKAWVQLPIEHIGQWKTLAKAATKYIMELTT